jgi:hypothetical protein
VLTVNSGTGSVIGSGTSLQVKKATTSQDGYLASSDWTTFNGKSASFSSGNLTESTSDVLTIGTGMGRLVGGNSTIQVMKATTSQDGYLSSADWTTFNSKSASFTSGNLTESTSDVLTIGSGTGALVSSATLQVKKATASQDGYLASSDWTTFRNSPNLYDTSGTVQATPHLVTGQISVTTTATVNLSGSAVYTSSSSYVCTFANTSAYANSPEFAPQSGSQFYVENAGTTATYKYICVGN